MKESEYYAGVYLKQIESRQFDWQTEWKSDDEFDKELYSKLVELEKRLGTKASEQLYYCLYHTTRSDIIKVGGFLV